MTPRTVRATVTWVGRGLFTGERCRVRLSPAADGYWVSLNGALAERIAHHHLAPLPLRSRLLLDAGPLSTPEHLLAALVLLDLDGASIAVDGSEIPLLDGSSLPFLRALLGVGVTGGPPFARGPLEVGVDVRGAAVAWTGGDLAPARARTFAEASHAKQALRAGLFPGARPGDALIVDSAGRRVRGGRGRRLAHEPTWHKLLDVLGDLGPARSEGSLVGHLSLVDPSHRSNVTAIAAALRDGRLRRAAREAA